MKFFTAYHLQVFLSCCNHKLGTGKYNSSSEVTSPLAVFDSPDFPHPIEVITKARRLYFSPHE